MVTYHVIGQPTPRVDGAEKATGQARYAADVSLPGTLWGKSLHSPYAHARIVRIDTTAAQQVPGVHAVITGADVRGGLWGRAVKDVPVLAYERIRFCGERVAAVAADDADSAQRVLELIEVEYDELPAVLEPLAALRDDAPILHPDCNAYVGFAQTMAQPSGQCAVRPQSAAPPCLCECDRRLPGTTHPAPHAPHFLRPNAHAPLWQTALHHRAATSSKSGFPPRPAPPPHGVTPPSPHCAAWATRPWPPATQCRT
jgi:CO/xanthine dehydrogenase Mo-binding subunit